MFYVGFQKKKCKLLSLTVCLPGNNPALHMNVQVNYINLELISCIRMEECKSFLESNMKYKVKQLQVSANQNKEVMNLLLDSIRNVEVLNLDCSSNCQDWLTIDIFTKWKLTKLSMNELRIPLIMNIIQKKN